MVKLAAILVHRKMVNLAATAKNSQVSSNFAAANIGQVTSHIKKTCKVISEKRSGYQREWST